MRSDHDSYFDEAYFERGHEKGTAYNNYINSAPQSPTYHEIAEAIFKVFKPKKCLEIGCATGVIVNHLNQMGVDAHGIDVSAWAIENKMHQNVHLSGADQLPFPNNTFDLIYSCHALEHIPRILLEKSVSEIDRVSTFSAVQFHMLPIVGTHPYEYDEETVIKDLKKDPTHNVLEIKSFWLDQWRHLGWNTLSSNILFFSDASEAQLSSGQFIISKNIDTTEIYESVSLWNLLVHRNQFTELEKYKNNNARSFRIDDPETTFSEEVSAQEAKWVDFSKIFTPTVSIDKCEIQLIIRLKSQKTTPLRMAFLDKPTSANPSVIEYWSEFEPGISAVRIPIGNFNSLRGSINLTKISHFYFGGNLENASFKIMASIVREDGTYIPLR
jgi:ubiquinone/menaquinone biosynthesis C-methylase UbiE